MHLEQYLIKIGVDISQVNNLTKVTTLLEISAMKLSNIGNVINDSLTNVITGSNKSVKQAAESSEEAKSKFEILKESLDDITTVAKKYGDKIVSAVEDATKSIEKSIKSIEKTIKSTKEAAGNTEKLAESTDKAAKSAEKSKSNFESLKEKLVKISSAAKKYGEKIVDAFNSAIDKAEELSTKKNLLFSISKKELALVKKYKAEIEKSGLAIDTIKTKIALGLLPSVTDLVMTFNKWLETNKELVAKGINVVVSVVSSFIQVIKHAFEFIDMIISNTIGWENAIIALSVAWAILNRAMLFSPLGLIIGLITGLLLIIDDFMVFLKGGKSLFGPFWQACIDSIKAVIDWWQNLDKNWKSVIFALLGYLLLVGGKLAWLSGKAKLISSLTKAIVKVGNAFKALGAVVKVIRTIGVAIKALTAVMMANPILAIISAIALACYLIYDNWDGITSFFSNLWDNVTTSCRNAAKDILMYFGMSEENAEKTVETIGRVFDATFDFLTSPFEAAVDFVKNLFSIWTDDSTSTMEKIGKSFEAAIDFISTPFKEGWKLVKDLFNIWGVDLDSFIDGIKDAFSKVFDFIKKPFSDGKKWIKDNYDGFLNKAKNGIKDKLSWLGINMNNDEEKKLNDNKNLANVNTNFAYAGSLSSSNTNLNNNSVTIHNTMNVTQAQDGFDSIYNIVDNTARRINDNTCTAMGSN